MKRLFPVLLAVAVWAQVAQFEVASIRKYVPPPAQAAGVARKAGGRRGGPGTSDPGQITWAGATLKALLMNAYGVKSYQISGPAWLESERFDVVAKVPPDTSKEQALEMWRNLLAERFQLKVHRETRDIPIYELSVGKNGPKMKESPPEVKGAEPPGRAFYERPPMGPDGCPVFPPGRGGSMMMMLPGRYRLCATLMSMGDLINTITSEVDRPIFDRTGLTGRYDLKLEFAPERAVEATGNPDAEPALPLAAAVQSLGLRLEAKKAPAGILVIDGMERTPSEN